MSANTNPLRDRRKKTLNANTRAQFQVQQTAKVGGTSFADITTASRRSFMEIKRLADVNSLKTYAPPMPSGAADSDAATWPTISQHSILKFPLPPSSTLPFRSNCSSIEHNQARHACCRRRTFTHTCVCQLQLYIVRDSRHNSTSLKTQVSNL